MAATTADPLADFAAAHGLAFAPGAVLPAQGATLSRGDGVVEGAASGSLPGGVDGTLARFKYTYTWTDSDDHSHTETRRFTLVVTEIPESIGFLPSFGFSGPASHLNATTGSMQMRQLDLGKSGGLARASAYAFKGTDENWLTQLLSPSLLDWLGRCEDDFGFELANGVLCAGRSTYLTTATELTALCEEAARVATAIREESLEEVDTGGAEAKAAKDPKGEDGGMEAALAKVKAPPPADVTAASAEFASYLRRSPLTWWRALRYAVLLTLVLNVPGAAVPIVLAVQGQYALLGAIELGLVAIVFVFAFRSRVGDKRAKYANEAFFRAYAESRRLKLEEPLRFAATHAEAKLPFKPDRVLSGELPGGATGSLVLCGDGSKRSDRIAIVAGPRGPVAEAELRAEAPALSAKSLDAYAERLGSELREKAPG